VRCSERISASGDTRGTAVGGRRSERSITWNCLDFYCNSMPFFRCDKRTLKTTVIYKLYVEGEVRKNGILSDFAVVNNRH
jgi:hypothetical protein